jgi:hypothetical protein
MAKKVMSCTRGTYLRKLALAQLQNLLQFIKVNSQY